MPKAGKYKLVVCGLMLFALGLISLFTGHVASDLKYYSQRLVRYSWFYKLIIAAIINLGIAGISTTIDEAASRSKHTMVYPIFAFVCACIALFFTCVDFIISAYK